MCETTDLIKRLAHEGKSKLYIRRALGGIGRVTFNHMLDAIGDVKFYAGDAYTVRGFHGTIVQIIEHFNIPLSNHIIRRRLNIGYDVDDCFFVNCFGRSMTVRGFSGSSSQIIRHFDLKVTVQCVSRRMANGWSVEKAFFEPVVISQVKSMKPENRARRIAELTAAYSQPLFA